MGHEVEDGEEGRGRFLHTQEAGERPLSVELGGGEVARVEFVHGAPHALVATLVQTRPAEDALQDRLVLSEDLLQVFAPAAEGLARGQALSLDGGGVAVGTACGDHQAGTRQNEAQEQEFLVAHGFISPVFGGFGVAKIIVFFCGAERSVG